MTLGSSGIWTILDAREAANRFKLTLFKTALAACSSVPLDQRFWITAQVISATPNADLRMLAIDLLIPNSEASRDNALSAIRTLVPVIAELDGTTVVGRLIADVRLSADG
jgi:hypothetical protein